MLTVKHNVCFKRLALIVAYGFSQLRVIIPSATILLMDILLFAIYHVDTLQLKNRLQNGLNPIKPFPRFCFSAFSFLNFFKILAFQNNKCLPTRAKILTKFDLKQRHLLFAHVQ